MVQNKMPERGGLGGVQFPYSREYVGVVVEEVGYLELGLGGVATGGASDRYESEKEDLINNTNHLLELMGIDLDNWYKYVDVVECKHGDDVSGRRLAATPPNKDTATAGDYLHDKAFWDMPMENNDSGDGRVTILMSPDDEFSVRLVANGSYWRDWLYRHPISHKIVVEKDQGKGPDNDLWKDGVEPEYLRYEDHHTITFRAVIESATPEQVAA